MIDTSGYDEKQSEVFDDIMDALTPGQRNKVLGINVKAVRQVRSGVYEDATITTIERRPRAKMTPLRLLWLPVVLVTSMAGFACLLLSLAICATLIGLPIGIPMFLGSTVAFWGPWQKWIWGTTGNIWYVGKKTA